MQRPDATKSQVHHCLDLWFKKPPQQQIVERKRKICRKEGLGSIEPKTMEAMVESCGSDIRQLLNQLQMAATCTRYSPGRGELGAFDMQKHLETDQKDQNISHFDACKKLLSTA